MDLLKKILLGLDERELLDVPLLQCRIHRQMVAPLMLLHERAASAGFDLRIASSYRSFERQLLIWNNKALGLRPVLDSDGKPLDLAPLTEREKVFAILRWSALPGASRHHWGSDVDVYGSAQIDEGYQLQLTVAETECGGPFADFHCWLSEELQRPDCAFYRPYAQDSGGIAPEPWHLSYAPLARDFARHFNEDLLREQLTATDLQLKTAVLENLHEIYTRFICVDD